MNTFELPLKEGNPINIEAYELHLQNSSPELKEKKVAIEKYIPKNKRIENIQYKDACFEDGCVNICVVRYESNVCQIHLFGNIKGKEISSVVSLSAQTERNFDMLNERVRFILGKSKTILKSYYQDGKVRNIQHHLVSFLTDIK